VLRNADSLFEKMRRDNLSSRDDITLCAACIVAFNYAGKYGKIDTLLQQIEKCQKSTNLNFNLHSEWLMANVLGHVLQVFAVGRGEDSAALKGVIERFCNVAYKGREMNLLKILSRTFDYPNRDIPLSKSYTLISGHPVKDYMSKMLAGITESEYMIFHELVWNILVDRYAKGDYQYFIHEVSALRKKMHAGSMWLRDDRRLPVYVYPLKQQEAELLLMLGDAYIKTGDSLKAVAMYSQLVAGNPKDRDYGKSIAGSAYALANYYSHKSLKDSAAQYVGLLYSINAQQKDDVYEEVSKTFKGAFYTKEEIISKYYDPSYLIKKKVGNLEITATDGESISIDKNSGTTIFVLASTNCSVCRNMVPPLLNLLFGDNIRDKIVFMTDKKDYPWLEDGVVNRTDEFHYASVDDAALKALDIRSEPAFCVVKNGEIIGSGGVSETAYSQIRKIISENGNNSDRIKE